MLEQGDAILFRIALAMVSLLEPRLYVRDTEELQSVLHGTNKGAIRVWRRDVYGISDDTSPPQDQIYAQYQMSEKAVFEQLHAQEGWWKDLTLRRLLDRELNQ